MRLLETTLLKPLIRLYQHFEPPMPPDARHNFRLDVTAAFSFGLFWGAVSPFLQVIAVHLGADATMLSWLIAAPFIGSVANILSGRVFPRHPYLPRMIWCWRISRGLFFLIPWITQSWQLLAMMMVFWVFEILPSPPYAAIVRDLYPERVRGQAMSMVRLGMAITLLLMAPLAGWLLDHIGYHILFPAVAVFGILAAEIFSRLRLAPPSQPEPSSHTQGIWSIISRDRRFLLYLIVMNLWGFGFIVASPFYPIIQVDRLQLSYSDIGILGLLQSAAWVLSLLFYGRLLDKRGALWTLRLSLSVAVLIPGAYFISYTGWVLAIGFIATGIVLAGLDLSHINAIAKLAPPGRIPTYMAIMSIVGGFRGLITPFLGTWLAGAGLGIGGVLLLAAISIAMGSLLLPLVSTKFAVSPPQVFEA